MLMECKMVRPFWKTVCQFLTKQIFLPYNPTIRLLGIYSNDLKISVHAKTCPQMFLVALFIVDQTWKHSRYPPVDE
jgi:hypothetical protein